MATKTYLIGGVPVEIRLFTAEELAAEFDEDQVLVDSLDAIVDEMKTETKPA